MVCPSLNSLSTVLSFILKLQLKMSDAQSSMLDLVQQIEANTKLLSDYLQQNSLPAPSLAANSYPCFPGTGPPDVDRYPRINEDVRQARIQLRESCASLMQVAAGPAEAAFACLALQWTTPCMQFVYRYRLAEHVPVEGDISYESLASKAGVAQGQCTRVLKYLMTQSFFRLSRPGYVAHNALSKMFLSPGFNDVAGYLTEETFVGSAKLAEATEKFAGSQEKNATAWNIGHDTDLPMFEYFEKHPGPYATFHGMHALSGFRRRLQYQGPWSKRLTGELWAKALSSTSAAILDVSSPTRCERPCRCWHSH